jgi:hypothetical protein
MPAKDTNDPSNKESDKIENAVIVHGGITQKSPMLKESHFQIIITIGMLIFLFCLALIVGYKSKSIKTVNIPLIKQVENDPDFTERFDQKLEQQQNEEAVSQ